MHVFVSGRIFSAREREGPAELAGAWQPTSKLPGSPLPKKPRHAAPAPAAPSRPPSPPRTQAGASCCWQHGPQPLASPSVSPQCPLTVPSLSPRHVFLLLLTDTPCSRPTTLLIPISLHVRPGEVGRECGEAARRKPIFLGGKNNLRPNGFVAPVAETR